MTGKHIPIRTCVGCRRRDAQERLVRIAVDQGRPVVDPMRKRPGRGAYVHADPVCATRAVRGRGLARGLRLGGAIPTDSQHLLLDQLMGEIAIESRRQ
ncbi:MAG: YlxR family protein [Deltaproteobacteria bacterium]|nr:MAG: YlxR family protein [Deltaproteobacteria bacterium]